jgi:hypothetical protein
MMRMTACMHPCKSGVNAKAGASDCVGCYAMKRLTVNMRSPSVSGMLLSPPLSCPPSRETLWADSCALFVFDLAPRDPPSFSGVPWKISVLERTDERRRTSGLLLVYGQSETTPAANCKDAESTATPP